MKTILIVDDTFENLYLLRVILEEVGYVVVEAKDGKEGLEKLHECSVDLIISDILMPVMDGYMFCQACKKEESFKNIPFIFYTSTYTEALDEDFAIKLGADHFLRKPTDQNKIAEVVQGLLGKAKLEVAPVKDVNFTEEEVLKLYSKRLISKLEHKNLDLEKEVLEREKAEQLLIHKNEILDLIALNIPLNEIFDRLLLNYESVHPDYYGSISLMNQDGTHLDLESAPSLPKLYKLAAKRIPVGPNVGSCGSAAFHKKSIIVSDISTDPLWVDYKNIALKFNLNSCWSIPFFSKDKAVIGTFAIYSTSISAPSLSDIRELNFTLNLVNIAIEKSRIVAEIKTKDESYRALIDQANDAIISYSLDGEIHDFNKAAYTSLGYTKNEFLNLKIQDFNVGDFVQNVENHNRLLAGEAIIFARKFLRKDKSFLDLEVSAKLQKDGKILGIARDVTERKKAELKLLESEYSLRQSQIVANIGSYTVDIPTKNWESSAVLNKIFGIDKSYLRTESGWSDIIHPEEREDVLAYYESCILNRKKINIEYRAIRIDNRQEIWVHARGEFLFDNDANPVKIIGTTQDITERKKAEVKLRESEYNLRQSQIVGNIGSYTIDIRTDTWEGSVLLYSIFGIPQSYPKNMEGWIARVHPEEREEMASYFENCVLNNEKFNREYRILKLDTKEEIWVHGIGKLVFDNDGNPIKVIGTIQDITHRKTAEIKLQEREYQLRQSQIVGNIGSYSVDINKKTWEGSAVLDAIFGLDETFVKTITSWGDCIHADEREGLLSYFENCIINNKKFNKEYRVVKQDTAEEVWVHGIGELVFDKEANPIKMIGTIQDITHRKQSELKLQESEYQLRKSQVVANLGSYSLDLKAKTWEGSPMLDKILGIGKEFVKTIENWGNLIHSDEREEILLYLENSIQNKTKFNKEYRLLKQDTKKEIWAHGIGELVFDSAGNAVKIIGTMQDITERKHAELKLQESEKSLLVAQEVAKIGSFNLRIENLVGDTSATFNAIIGVGNDARIDFDLWKSIVHPEDRSIIKENVYESQKHKKKFDLEYRIITKDTKELKWIHGLGEVIYVHGEAKNFVGTIQDITQRKNIELDLKKANEFSSSLLVSMHEGLVAINLESEIISVNPAFCKMTGFTEKELIGVKRPFPYSPPELREENDARYKLLTQNKNKKDYENTYMRKNGERFPVHVLVSSIYDENGLKTANFSTIQDITQRKKAEIDLKLAKDFSENLILNLNEGLSVVNLEGVQIEANPALCKMLRFKKEELVGQKTPFNYWPPEKWDEIQETYANILKGEYSKVELTFMRKNGERFPVLMSASFVKNNEGEIIANIATIQDISQRKQAEIKLQKNERSLLEAQKIAKIGSYSLNLKTYEIEASTTFKKILGLDVDSTFSFKSWADIIHPEDALLDKRMFKKSLKTGEAFDLEFRILTKNTKQLKWIHILGEVIRHNDEPVEFFGTIQDISQRKQSEVQLLESEYNLRQSQIVANIGTYSFDIVNDVWKSSGVLDKVFGIKKSFVKSMESWMTIIHPEDQERMLNYLEINILKNHEKFNAEYRVLKVDSKEEVWVHGMGELVLDNDGNPIKMFGTIQDITERKQSEIKIKESQKSLLEAQRIAKTGSFNLSLIDLIAETSTTFNEIIGVENDTLINFDTWKSAVYPEDRSIVKKVVLESQEHNKKFDLEYRILTKNTKKLKWIHGLGEIIYTHGKATNLVGTIQDITARKKAAIDLKIANEFTENLVMTMQEGLLMVDLDGTIIKVNDSLCEILGYSENELIGQELPYPFAQEKDYANMLKIKDEVAKGEALSFQLEFIKKEGSTFIASFLAGVIKNDEGETVAIFATIKDVSEEEKIKKTLEDIAIKSTEKKDVILELASLIGEDFDSSLKKIAVTSAKALHADFVTIWEYEKDKTELVSRLFYRAEDASVKVNELTICKEDFPNYFNAFNAKNCINIANVKSNPITKAFAKDFFIPNHISSRIDVLIYGRGSHYGIISFESKSDNRVFSADEEGFVTSIASIVSLMIESFERKTAENKIAITNQKLTEVNKELNTLREQLEQENVYLRNELDLVFNYEEMVYGSEVFSNVLTEVEKVAPTTATVLLLGESGTGKELLARAVHNTSLRNKKPLIKVNCSAIPRELIESELFGHKKGSFTGAINDKVGKFELADGGTLFLDEIGELPLDMQPKILRFLQEGEIEVVGGSSGLKKLDVRVIAATNRNLIEEVKKKQFREDLYFRLNVFPIAVPPLRDRKDDIPLLVEHFVDKFNKAYGKSIKYITDDAMSQLKAYDWPGNIRELENLIERASILSSKETLVIPGFESSTQKVKPINNQDLTLDAVQRDHIVQVLEQCNWKISGPNGAAFILGLKPSTLRDRMTKLGVSKIKKN